MKILLLVILVIVVFLTSGCAVTGGGQQQSAMEFAAGQAQEAKIFGGKFLRDALSEEGVCEGAQTSTGANINRDAYFNNQSGAVSFGITGEGRNRIQCQPRR